MGQKTFFPRFRTKRLQNSFKYPSQNMEHGPRKLTEMAIQSI